MRSIIVFLLTACILSAGSLSAQEIEYVSSTLHHNPYYSIGKVGDYVYCGGPYGIHIFEISDPSNPQLVKICDFPGIHRIFFDDHFAYLISRSSLTRIPGLRVLDISDPLNPQIVGSLDYRFEYFTPDLFYNNTIYTTREEVDSLGGAYSELIVIDVADPQDPSISDIIDLPMLESGMWVSDDYLHVTTTEFDFWYNYWSIFSLTDPAHPDHVSTMDFGENYVGGVVAYSNYAYLYFLSGVHIYDFSDPYDPWLVRVDDSDALAGIIDIEENVAYARGSNSIRTLDMTDPLYPVHMGSAYLQGGFYYFSYSGDTCFTTYISEYNDNASRFSVIDFTDLYNPTVIGEHWTSDKSYDVQLNGHFAYVANGNSGLTVVDISDPAEPVVLGSFEPSSQKDIFIKDDRAYILAGRGYFGIYDISDADQPVFLGDFPDFVNRCCNIFVDGDFAYITKVPYNNPPGSFVSILDVSDPSAPTPVYSIDNLYFPWYIIVDGDYAYVTCYEDLKIYNVANLDSITFAGSYQYRNGVHQITMDWPYVYMACAPNGIEVINVADPSNPYFLSEYDSLSGSNITLFDDFALLKGYHDLYLMDISNPESLALISSYSPSTGWYSEEVYIDGDYIYDATYDRLQILKLTPTGIEEVSSVDLSRISLSPNRPNPFNSSTTIEYALPHEADVTIEIYDILGRRVEAFFKGNQPAGSHSVIWDAENTPSGLYFYRIQAGGYVQTRKMVLLK